MTSQAQESSPNTLAQILPYDIWEYITGFLSTEEVSKLLPVNHALFNIAMNKRYRTSRIASLFYADTRRNLNTLTDPDVASRVHTFVFEPGPICYLLMEDQVVTLAPIGPNQTTKREKNTVVANLSTIMSQLNSLITLRIEIAGPHYEYFQRLDPPFFRIGWSSFRTSLRELELRVPIESMSAILPDLSVDNLEALTLDIMRAMPIITESEIIMLETLLPFLNAHRRSLQSLRLEAAERTNLSPLLDSVILPHLTRFKLVQPYFTEDSADYTGVRQFFKNHCHISSFEIVIGYPGIDDGARPFAIFSQRCFAVPLPNLQHLILKYDFADHRVPDALRDSVVGYIHRFKATLVSLKLSTPLLGKSVHQLVEGFRSSASLLRVELAVLVLDSELFAILADNLPALES